MAEAGGGGGALSEGIAGQWRRAALLLAHKDELDISIQPTFLPTQIFSHCTIADNISIWQLLLQWINISMTIKLISYQSEFWHLRRKPVIFSKWLFFQNFVVISLAKQLGNMQMKKWYNFWMFHYQKPWICFCLLLWYSVFINWFLTDILNFK